MDTYRHKNIVTGWVVSAALLGAVAAWAQPSAEELAERIDRLQEQQLSGIDQVSFTTEITEGMGSGTQVTTRFVKGEKDGRMVLEAVEEDDTGPMAMSGMHDGVLTDMIRHARSVDAGQLDGTPVYIVTVDDSDYLKTLGGLAMDEQMEAEAFAPKQAVIWLDQDDYLVHKLAFDQAGPNDGEMNMEVRLSDYRTHRGLPVSHNASVTVKGVESMVSPEEVEQARVQMKQLREQLDQLPPEQRAMIESQIAPHIEEFEKMMESGSTTMSIRVVDVSFDE